MKRHGGWRPNSGRKPGSRNKIPSSSIQAREMLHKKVMQEWTPLVESWLTAAIGDYYVESNLPGKDGEVKVYRAKPDTKAIMNIMEFLMGKPTQPIEGKIESPGIDKAIEAIRSILDNKPKIA